MYAPGDNIYIAPLLGDASSWCWRCSPHSS